MMENAQKIANNTYSIIARSCNKLMIGKTFWKSVALPSILYGTKVINLTEDEINKLRRIENSVWRQILGAPGYAPICTLRGEIGTSLTLRLRQQYFHYSLLKIRRYLGGFERLSRK